MHLLDTNILIDLAGERKSAPFFESLLNESNLQLGTSILCLAEFAAGAAPREEKFLRDWIRSRELEVIFLDAVEDAFEAGAMRMKQNLSLPDALILASAIRVGAHFITHDGTLLKKAKTFLKASDPFA